MNREILNEVKDVMCTSLRLKIAKESIPDTYQLAGGNLDSMSITTLILALEEHFGITFEEEELTAESFETLSTLSALVQQKLNSCNV